MHEADDGWVTRVLSNQTNRLEQVFCVFENSNGSYIFNLTALSFVKKK